MGGNILRSVIATVIGIVVAFALIWLAQYAGSALPSSGYNQSEYDVATEIAEIPIGPTIALIVGWFVGTFAGSWLAMRASGGSGAGWFVAGAVLGAAIYRASSPLDEWWILALGFAVPIAAASLAQRATAFASSSTT